MKTVDSQHDLDSHTPEEQSPSMNEPRNESVLVNIEVENSIASTESDSLISTPHSNHSLNI